VAHDDYDNFSTSQNPNPKWKKGKESKEEKQSHEAQKRSLKETLVNECAVLIMQFYATKPSIPFNDLLDEIEKAVLNHTLMEHAGCRAWAAKFLSMGRTHLMYRIKKFGKKTFMPPSEHLKFLIKEKEKR
jgi:DNA-binding NtrC family response regulator